MRSVPDRVTIQNVNLPGYTATLDGTRYRAVRFAMLKLLPHKAPGLAQARADHATSLAPAVISHVAG